MTELTPIGQSEYKIFSKYQQMYKDAIEKDWYFTGWKQKVFIIFCYLSTIASAIYWGWRIFA